MPAHKNKENKLLSWDQFLPVHCYISNLHKIHVCDGRNLYLTRTGPMPELQCILEVIFNTKVKTPSSTQLFTKTL